MLLACSNPARCKYILCMGDLMEVSVCTNVVAAREQDVVVTVAVLVCAAVVVEVDVTTARQADVARVVIVAEDVVAAVDQVFNKCKLTNSILTGACYPSSRFLCL